MTQKLTQPEQKLLLSLAREAIIGYVLEGKIPDSEVHVPALQSLDGCFVTIKKNGVLRGCIGSLVSDKPLYKLVRMMAIAAATNDPRFYPMRAADLDDFSIEISVLSPLKKISSPDDIKVGTHGIYIEKNCRHGVLLPQVAVEFGWDRDTFLSQTCLKAGLRPDDWQDGAEIMIFNAQVVN